MASTQEVNGRWRGRFRANGRQYTKTFDYQWEALQWAEDGERKAAAALGTIPSQDGSALHAGAAAGATAALNNHTTPAGQLTVAQYGRQWLDRTAHERETSSNNWNGTQLRLGIAPTALGRLPIAAVTKTDVQLWMSADARAGTGAPTRKGRLKVLRAIMRDAVANEAALRDPTAGVKMPTIEHRPPPNPSRTTLDDVIAACDDDTRLIVLLALDAGLRWGEAAGVPAEAVVLDDENPRIWIGQVVTRERRVRGYTKGKKARWVPITTDRLADALRARMATVESGLLFTDKAGRPVSYWRCRDGWRKARAEAGAPLRFHDLRHVFGSDLGNSGVPRRDVATVLGHADESTTAGYMHGNDQTAIFAAARRAKAAGR